EGELDAFGRARGDEHAIGRCRDPTPREIGGHRFASLGDARRRGVAVVPVAHGPGDGLNQVRRREETELVGIPDVEISDLPAALFYFSRLGDDIPDGVGEAVNTFGGTNGRGR